MAQIVWFAVLKSDQSSGKSGHKRPNFTRLSLCYHGLIKAQNAIIGFQKCYIVPHVAKAKSCKSDYTENEIKKLRDTSKFLQNIDHARKERENYDPQKGKMDYNPERKQIIEQ